MLEQISVDKFIYDTLSRDSLIRSLVSDRIYIDSANEDKKLPFIVFGDYMARDIQGVGPSRIYTDISYYITVVGNNGYYDLKLIVDQIDLLMQGKGDQEVEGVWLNRFHRLNVVRGVELFEGIRYYSIMQVYRNMIHPN